MQMNPQPPLVTAIIPMYNGERFVRDSVESVLSQTYSAIEILVVDDGSTDRSIDVLAKYAGRLRLIRQPNAGVANARNAGVEASRGEIVAFLDQDDWWQPTKIEKQVSVFVSDPEVTLVHTGTAHFDDQAKKFVGRLNPNCAADKLVGSCYQRLLLDNCIYNSTVAVRRSAVRRVGGFDTTIAGNTVADYDLWLRLAKDGTFAFVPEELGVFRLHSSQGTWNRKEMLTAEFRMLSRYVTQQMREDSKALRGRFARIHEMLGISYLDAEQGAEARRCFSNALAEERSLRRIGLYVATFLPAPVAEAMRTTKRALKGVTG